MKSPSRWLTILGVIIFCACPHKCCGQSNGAPFLSLTPGLPPVLTLNGTAGSNYQVQFTSQLPAPNGWAALTNILLSNSNFVFEDGSVEPGPVRFYRALLINSNTFTGYVPPQLTEGEIFQIDTTYMLQPVTETLIVLSPTNGIFLNTSEQNQQVPEGFYTVPIQFTASNLITAGLSVTFLSGIMMPPPPATNYFTMIFTATNAGSVLDYGVMPPYSGTTYGTFSLNTAYVGQTLAPSQLSSGEIWQITTTNNGTTNTATLVVESATNVWWIASGNPGVSAVSAVFTPENAFGGLLTVNIPASMLSPPTTNIYQVYFTAAGSGIFSGSTTGFEPTAGVFVRNTSFLGQTLAPSQFVTGYQAVISNAGGIYPLNLLVDSTNSWSYTTSYVGNSITNVITQFNPLGPMSGDLTISSAGVSTNVYLLVFTNVNAGASQGPYVPGPMQSLYNGGFLLNTNFIGQSLAPAQLAAGESWQFPASPSPSTALTMISATNCFWYGTELFWTLASVTYTPLGSFSGNLTIVIPPGFDQPFAATNDFMALFTAPDMGWALEKTATPGGLMPVQFENFSVNTNFAGQTFAPPQLTTGYSFQFSQTNTIPMQAIEATLVMTSATTGDWTRNGSSTIQSATVQYNLLGPLAAMMNVIVPGATNTFLLQYYSPSNGSFQLTNNSISTPSPALGAFTNSAP